MPHLGKLVDDSGWREVTFANHYALFMGYLSMAVRGLGFLVLTWTTVVLLGGFVSTLQKKDFWCLTFITLVQTAGIFDVSLTKKLSYIWDSFLGIVSFGQALVGGDPFKDPKCHGLLEAALVVELVVFAILLCPLLAVYMFGLLISAGISLWRLRQHDYGNNADGDVNLKPALDVLYSLALLQGVIFCSRTIFAFGKGSIVNTVVERSEFGDQTRALVSDYLREMMIGCEKDLSFAGGRNLITYAVDLMGSKSPDDYLSGLRILDAFARRLEATARKLEESSLLPGQLQLNKYMQEHVLVKHLIKPASSSDILQKLVQTLDHRSIYDREMRELATRIVANIALDISLAKFPRGIHYISSLLSTFKEYRLVQPYQRDWIRETFEQEWYHVAGHVASKYNLVQKDSDDDLLYSYKELVVQGLRILGKLATNDNNCRVMLDTQCLLSKIMAPVTSDLLHNIDHGAWSSIVEGSLQVMNQLVAARGQTGIMLRHEISSSKEAISTMERILECDKCEEKLKIQVIWILRHLYEDISSIMDTASREKFIEMLVNILTNDRKDKEIRRMEAGSALMALSLKVEKSARIIIKADDNVVDNLATMVVEKHNCGPCAAKILEDLCSNYTDDDERLKKLKIAMTNAVPKVLGILCWASEETHTGREVDQVRFKEPETDVENQCGDSQHNRQSNHSSSSPQQAFEVDEYGVVCMLSLCVTVCDTFICADQDLAHQFDAIAPGDDSFSFPRKLRKMVKKYVQLRPDCLEILKPICKMVISMMKHKGSYVKEDLESLMESLSRASKDMFILDGSVVFDTTALKPFRSLASLVEEAWELVDKYEAHTSSVVEQNAALSLNSLCGIPNQL